MKKIKVRNSKTGEECWWSYATYKLNGEGYMGWCKVNESERKAEVPLAIETFINENKKKDVPATAEVKDYESMTFAELKEEGEKLGIKSNSKKGYIEKLQEYESKA